jgi:hypothetical protein
MRAGPGTVVVGEQGGGDAHVADEGAGGLLAHARLVGLPAEAAEGAGRRLDVPDVVGAAGDAVAVASSGSARASRSASGIAASRPMPIIAGATRGEIEEVVRGAGRGRGSSMV